jgi:hypothetical protein
MEPNIRRVLLNNTSLQTRYFISYSGVTLPLNLVNELEDGIQQRITYFIGYYDSNGQLLKVEKLVYDEIEFTHEYSYDDTGKIAKAVITEEDEDPRILIFDEQGQANELC